MMWYYDSASGKCRSLQTFAGCANNKNYFANEHSCSRICKGMAVPNSGWQKIRSQIISL